jgi:hypothetical protein
MKFIANGSYCYAVIPLRRLTGNYSVTEGDEIYSAYPCIDIDLKELDLNIEFFVKYDEDLMIASTVHLPTVSIIEWHQFHKHNAPFHLQPTVTWTKNCKLYLYLISDEYRNFVKLHNLWFI